MGQIQVCMARFSDVITARRLRIRCHAGRTNRIKFAFLFWRFITLTVTSRRPKALSAVFTVCGAAHERSRRQKVRRRVQKRVKSDRNFSASFQHLPAALRQLLLQCCMVQSLQVYLCQWQKKVLFFSFFSKKEVYSPFRQQTGTTFGVAHAQSVSRLA